MKSQEEVSVRTDSLCHCCEQDENGNWIKDDPCCGSSGICEACTTNPEDSLSNCIHCGGEMFKEEGFWWHHTQREIPFNQRGTVHLGT